MINSPLLRGPASILFPPKACNFCIFRSKSRNYQFYQIFIVSAPDQLDQAVCKVSLIPASCSPTRRSATTRAKGVGATITCELCKYVPLLVITQRGTHGAHWHAATHATLRFGK